MMQTKKSYLVAKRIMDIIFSLLVLIILSPLLLIVAILIKLDDKDAPVIFKQERVGQGQKPFICHKFRSMKPTAPHACPSTKLKNRSEHVTKIGKFIRRTSIDELPQLYDVLIGNMSLIGFRPSLAAEEKLNKERQRLGVYELKPGLTGWAQIHGRESISGIPEYKAYLDGEYTKNISLWLDIKIFFSTIGKIITQEGVLEGTNLIPKSKIDFVPIKRRKGGKNGK